MAYLTPEQAERDELVARLLAAAPSGITQYQLDRKLHEELRRPGRGWSGSGTGRTSLIRLEAAGRARCVEEPHASLHGFRRVWYPVAGQERGRT